MLWIAAPVGGLIWVLCLAASGPAATVDAAVGGRPFASYSPGLLERRDSPEHRAVEFPGAGERVTISRADPSAAGPAIEVASRSGKIAIGAKPWHELLGLNRGGQLTFEVFVQSDGMWQRFDAFGCTIAREDIDDYLAYRRIRPVHSAWRDMGIYQRDLRSFDESVILSSEYFGGGCVNCHTFCNNRADTMLVSTRSKQYTNAAMIIRDGAVDKVDGHVRIQRLAPEWQDAGVHVRQDRHVPACGRQ